MCDINWGSVINRCKKTAREKGYPSESEDFSQWFCLRCLETGVKKGGIAQSTIEWRFIDYLRKTHSPRGKKFKFIHDTPRGEPITDFFIGKLSFEEQLIFSGAGQVLKKAEKEMTRKEKRVYRSVLGGEPSVKIAKRMKTTQSNVSLILKSVLSKVDDLRLQCEI